MYKKSISITLILYIKEVFSQSVSDEVNVISATQEH